MTVPVAAAQRLRVFVPCRYARVGRSAGRVQHQQASPRRNPDRRNGVLCRVSRTMPPETDRSRLAQDWASHQSGSSAPLARAAGGRLAPKVWSARQNRSRFEGRPREPTPTSRTSAC